MACRKFAFSALAAVVLLIPAAISLGTGGRQRADNDPIAVVGAYLQATYARDYSAAYSFISSRDQQVWDEKSYARQYGSFTGFALELAQSLAAGMKIWVIKQQMGPNRIQYEIGYEIPTADELSSRLMDWDQDKLNSLSRPQQEQLRAALSQLEKTGKMVMLKGQEMFSLIAEGGRWKIFHDWAAASKVRFRLVLPRDARIEAQLVTDGLLVKRDEPFEIAFKMKNLNDHAVTVRIIHHVEPRSLENNLEMIACGALLPLVLQPNDEQEISMAYLIRDGIQPGAKFAVTYELAQEPAAPRVP